MVEPNKEFDDMIDPVELQEPDGPDGHDTKSFDPPKGIWMRGLYMIILGLMFALAETILCVVAVVQFFWMLFTKNKNQLLAEFGQDMGKWLSDVAQFQTGATEDKPFPWKKWGA